MLCATCETPFTPHRLFCLNCGDVSPEGARVMGLSPVADAPRSPAPPVAYRPPVRVVPWSAPAVASLAFGIVCWFAMPLLGALLAVGLGHHARRLMSRHPNMERGAGLALAGLLLGYAHLLVSGSVLLAAGVAVIAGLWASL